MTYTIILNSTDNSIEKEMVSLIKAKEILESFSKSGIEGVITSNKTGEVLFESEKGKVGRFKTLPNNKFTLVFLED